MNFVKADMSKIDISNMDLSYSLYVIQFMCSYYKTQNEMNHCETISKVLSKSLLDGSSKNCILNEALYYYLCGTFKTKTVAEDLILLGANLNKIDIWNLVHCLFATCHSLELTVFLSWLDEFTVNNLFIAVCGINEMSHRHLFLKTQNGFCGNPDFMQTRSQIIKNFCKVSTLFISTKNEAFRICCSSGDIELSQIVLNTGADVHFQNDLIFRTSIEKDSIDVIRMIFYYRPQYYLPMLLKISLNELHDQCRSWIFDEVLSNPLTKQCLYNDKKEEDTPKKEKKVAVLKSKKKMIQKVTTKITVNAENENKIDEENMNDKMQENIMITVESNKRKRE